jgi:uncharacterized protein
MPGESFSERLRRLQRDGRKDGLALPFTVPAPKDAADTWEEIATGSESHKELGSPSAKSKGAPVWLRYKLRGIGEVGTSKRVRRSPLPSKQAVAPRPLLTQSRGMPKDLQEFQSEQGTFAARVIRRPKSDLHGNWKLEWAQNVDGTSIEPLVRDSDLGGFDGGRAVYLDIETTGLGGGVGTWPFMVALGRFDGDEFELWQGFLREPGEEAALLAEVARQIASAGALVSFFGKSFDRHRLEDKMRMHHIEPPFSGLPHLDLYHPLNRLYCRRGGWDKLFPGQVPAASVLGEGQGFVNGKLSTMERELCGLQREDDLSGAYAPEAWFDFLGERPHLLEHVFRHNADDVWSLATLTAHLGRTAVRTRPDGSPLEGPELARLIGLATLARDRAERKAEAQLLCEVKTRLGDGIMPRKLALWLADARRLAGEECFDSYEQLAGAEPDFLTARIEVELAKLLEHKRRDFCGALRACERAREATIVHGPRSGTAFHKQLDARASRLSQKLQARVVQADGLR